MVAFFCIVFQLPRGISAAANLSSSPSLENLNSSDSAAATPELHRPAWARDVTLAAADVTEPVISAKKKMLGAERTSSLLDQVTRRSSH